ncbi:MAG: preprotein translocase subunit SecG [Deltaproteobacteria bacterium]|nr:preprotein translocase subunit SecG [Deltaproteobacteria bacterium]
MMTVILVLHFMVCFVLITVVLLQRGKGADLGAALGGGGANTVFGSRGAGNFLTRLTTGSAILFMLTSLSLAYIGTHESEVGLFDEKALQEEQAAEQAGKAVFEEDAQSLGLEDVGLEEVGGLEEIDPSAQKEAQTPTP